MKNLKEELTFTQSLSRLEQIVAKLEEPDLDLEEGLKLLEEGVKLHRSCKEKLTEASKRINLILKDDQDEAS